MNASQTFSPYRKIATQTAPPGQLILQLFDGALLALERALVGFATTDPGEKNRMIHNNLRRAVDIIRHLNHSLNLEAGGDLAQTLRRLYNYFDVRLVESNLTKQRSGIDEVIRHLTGIREAWAKMLVLEGEGSSPEGLPDAETSRLASSI